MASTVVRLPFRPLLLLTPRVKLDDSLSPAALTTASCLLLLLDAPPEGPPPVFLARQPVRRCVCRYIMVL